MRKKRVLVTSLLVLLIVSFGFEAVSSQPAADGAEAEVPLPRENPAPTITVQAASRATIGFTPQNGKTTYHASPQTLRLPHLVLTRNGALTPHDERTLIVTVSDLVPHRRG
jgi:hypothetical protein